jgi:lactate permease
VRQSTLASIVSEAGIPDVSILNWLLAISPIGSLLVLMVVFNWSGARAGAAAWLVAFGISILAFGGGSELLAYSQVKAALLSVWVLYIIWAALLLFHIVDEAGSIKTIGQGITRITGNRVMQLILLAWVFTTFLQGVAGYGIPVAVVAPLMVGMGFSPVAAVVTTSVGHSWSVTFGSLAASFFAMAGVSELPTGELAIESAVLLGLACFLCGFGAVWAFGGWRAIRQGAIPLLLIGTLMAGTQLGMASLGTYPLAAFTAGCLGLVGITGLARLPFFRRPDCRRVWTTRQGCTGSGPFRSSDVLLAFSAYLILVVIVLCASFIEPLTNLLDRGAVRLSMPETSSSVTVGPIARPNRTGRLRRSARPGHCCCTPADSGSSCTVSRPVSCKAGSFRSHSVTYDQRGACVEPWNRDDGRDGV